MRHPSFTHATTSTDASGMLAPVEPRGVSDVVLKGHMTLLAGLTCLDLLPAVLQRHRAVEDQVAGRRVGIADEVPSPLELVP